MARNDRLGTGWSQPRRSAAAKSHSGCVGGQGTGDLDDLGDIMSLLSGCNKSKSKESWQVRHGNPSSRHFASRDCCLKNGRIHCSCLWSKNDFSLDSQNNRRKSFGSSALANDSLLSYERKVPFWQENNISNQSVGNKMAEEYVLDDNELCFDFYDIPFNMPKRHQIRKMGKVKTVSIIDTLSELASGATDREDEGGFSSAVSESAILSHDPYRSRAKQSRHAVNRRDRGTKKTCFPSAPVTTEFPTKLCTRHQVNSDVNVCHDSIFSSQFKNVCSDDGNFTCSSLKRTLKYLRKAVSSNVVEEEPRVRRHVRRHEEKDILRHCFSDSEVREVPKPWTPARREKQELNFRSKSRSLLTVNPQVTAETPLPRHTVKPVNTSHSRPKVDAPDWIKTVFSAAKKGDVEKLKDGLKDIDSALVRNLSDDHGNNIWHICAAQNHIQCLDWLCARNKQQSEALKDENKHGFTPIALAVKHGSLLAVQWLIHNTISKSQLSGTGDNRSLLHIAAKYGQETVVQWLLSYMNTQDIDVNCSDSEGNTALHLAAKHGNINCVKILIFQNGNIKARNDRGLKPLNLAVKYSQVNCADYLLAMESCYNLASNNLKQQSELQQLHKENAELKNYFKELLTLTKRLQHRQRELVQTFMRNDQAGQYDCDINERNSEKHIKYIDEYSQLLAAVIADEEHRLLLVEDRWKKSRKQPKLTDSKKGPLDVIRSHFTHILDKVSDQSPAIPSTPETSDDSWQSGDDDTPSLPLGGFSASIFDSTPDVINALPNQHVPCADTRNIQLQNEKSVNFSNKQTEAVVKVPCSSSPVNKSKQSLDIKTSTVRSIPGGARDVNLQVFFKQNPNLRQTSETCSVLEVLEPSSSDSDDCIKKKRRSAKELNIDEELIQSSSSSAAETLSPSSCGPSSSGSKKSGSRSSSNGSRHDVSVRRSGNVPNIYCSGNASKSSVEVVEKKETENVNNSDNVDTLNRDVSPSTNFENNVLAEPDLLRGTQKKKHVTIDKDEHRREKDNSTKDIHTTDNPSISTEDSESLEADRSFCSAIDVQESLLVSQMLPDPSVPGTGVKKKSFLLKFALRGKWPSKHRPRSSKNEISAEEFRETYSRSSENAMLPSQCITTGVSVSKKMSSPHLKDTEKIQEQMSVIDSSNCVGRNFDSNPVFSTPCGDMSRSSLQHSNLNLLPPRRDPPPVPPRPPRDKVSPMHSEDNIQIDIPNSSSSCMTESAISLHDPYNMSSSSSNLWQSPDSKSLFRPASSASRVESPSRADESFPLNKSSSASTEILSALDSSTAGRQSPAPSEVSKTESALSPPSDVSKTESTRYLSQLGRIEESSHLAVIKAATVQSPATEDQNIESLQDRNSEKNDGKIRKKSSNSKKNNPDKPWYEFSDEEDLITPQRYEVMSGRMRSSSEDEEVVIN